MSEPKEKSNPAFGFREIFIVVCLIGIFALIAIPNFVSNGRNSPGGKSNACINNLRRIDAAKNEWASENGKTNGAVVTENDLKPYIKLDSRGNLPKCPSGGTYTIGKVGEPPTCSLGTTVNPPHVLP